MRIAALAAVAALFCAASAAASPPALERHVCPNGLEVIVAPRHSTPLVTVEIAVHNGTMTESPEYSGLSHLYEHMFAEGNAAVADAPAFLQRTFELGILFGATTLEERANYYFTTTSDHLGDAMVFLRDAITTPLFDGAQLARERLVVTGELDREESSPEFLLWRAMVQKAFGKLASRKGPDDRRTVLAATPAKMRTIQRRYYVPNNAALVVTGDVDAADVFARADRDFASWARGPDPFVAFPLVHHPPLARSEALVVSAPVPDFSARIEWLGPSAGDASVSFFYPNALLSELVNAPSSSFQRHLVDSGPCLGAEMEWQTARNVMPLVFAVHATEANAEACVRAVMSELPKLKSAGYFTDEEMTNAARAIEVRGAKAREGTEGAAHQISWYWAAASLDYFANYEARVRAVTRADIAAHLDTYILGKKFIVGALESPALARKLDRARLEGAAGIAREGSK